MAGNQESDGSTPRICITPEYEMDLNFDKQVILTTIDTYLLLKAKLI